jgi:CRP-like cAMP-binding protein
MIATRMMPTAPMARNRTLRPLSAHSSEPAVLLPDQLKALGADRFAELGAPRRFAAGTIIIEAHDPEAPIAVITSGCVRLLYTDSEGREVGVGLRRAPALLGEEAAMAGSATKITVETVMPCRAVLVPREVFARLLVERPEVARSVLAGVSAQLMEAWTAAAGSSLASVEQRLAQLFLSLAQAVGVDTAEGVHLACDGLSLVWLARHLGVARKSVQRTVQRWRRDGILSTRGRYHVLRDRKALLDIAGLDG